MSDENSSPSDSDGALDLSDLNFGPAWARDPSESKSLKKFKNRGDREERRGGGDRRDDRRGGGRRDQGGGGGFRGPKGKGGGYRGDDRRPVRQEVEPPEGVDIQLMPAEESLDLLARRVLDSGQTFSVFDLAKVLLQSRDRFRVTFETSEKKLFRCREDQSIWLSRNEALRHLWRGDWIKKFYDEVQVEGEVPKGSFNAVARCGLSNEILGPPNYHGYQAKLVALHRERFANMPLDAYKAKVRMEHGEEAVEAWLESMKTVTRWKVAEPQEEETTGEAEKAEEPKDVEEASASPADQAPEKVKPANEEQPEATPEIAEETEAAGEESAPVEEEAGETADETDEMSVEDEEPAAEAETPEESPAAADDQAEVPAELFDDTRAVERHFMENHFDEVFEETDRAWVTGDIPGKLLSPGLLTLLKRCVAEEKRYPAKLMPIVCRQLSGRHVAVFKWNKKLKVGPSRPHSVPADTSLAERPRHMLNHLTAHTGTTLKDFWKAVMPEGVTAEQKHDWLQDFQWLLGEGHIILLADTTVHLAKKGKAPAPHPADKSQDQKQTKEKAKAPEEKPTPERSPTPEPTPTPEKNPAPDKTPAPEETSPAEGAPQAESPQSDPSGPEGPETEGKD